MAVMALRFASRAKSVVVAVPDTWRLGRRHRLAGVALAFYNIGEISVADVLQQLARQAGKLTWRRWRNLQYHRAFSCPLLSAAHHRQSLE